RRGRGDELDRDALAGERVRRCVDDAHPAPPEDGLDREALAEAAPGTELAAADTATRQAREQRRQLARPFAHRLAQLGVQPIDLLRVSDDLLDLGLHPLLERSVQLAER